MTCRRWGNSGSKAANSGNSELSTITTVSSAWLADVDELFGRQPDVQRVQDGLHVEQRRARRGVFAVPCMGPSCTR